MEQKTKALKGEIRISNAQGRIRLRWSYNGERYSLSLPYAYIDENLPHATIKVAEIKLDMLKGDFDTSLKKYNPSSVKVSNTANRTVPLKQDTFSQLACTTQIEITDLSIYSHLGELISEFNDWTKNILNVDIDNSFDYLYTRKLLEKWRETPIIQITQKLSSEEWAASTYNRRLGYLKKFFTWLLDSKKIQHNPLLRVVRRKIKRKKKNPRRIPLNSSEIIQFLEAIKNNTYCPTASHYKHSHYYAFLRFIFLTGVRNAEAIGLKVKHIDFSKRQIEISEALARTIKGTHHAARIEKETKTGNSRILPLTNELYNLLIILVEGKKPNDLVFLSPKGLSIDDRMLQRRVIKPVFIKLKIEIRDLYVARHSFGTRAVQQNIPLTEIAYLMGHSTIETAVRNYVDVGSKGKTLPELNQ